MASFTEHRKKDGSVSHRAHICLNDVRASETFDSKGAARAWATRTEADILAGARGEIPDRPFGDALERFADMLKAQMISVQLAKAAGKRPPEHRKGGKWELVRINKLLKDPLAAVPLRELDSSHVAAWRDRSLMTMAGASVRREWNLLSAICSTAIGEWKWLKLNPFYKAAGAKRPKNSPHREELIMPADLAALQAAADAYASPSYRQVMRVCRFAIETAMRSGEIIFLGENPERVKIFDTPGGRRGVAHLPDTKNGNKRDVGLSEEAVRLWEAAAADDKVDPDIDSVWGLNDATRDKHWRDLRDAVAKTHPPVARLKFHDSRHTAATQLSEKLEILELARMGGWTNLKELMTYYQKSAADIALKL